MTITEFLLARIAEDERRARVGANFEGADFMLAALPMPLFDSLVPAFPIRALAECEAKRRIIERCTAVPEGASWEHEGLMDDVLQALASVYADHPDYREEWRP